ncbi:hypothetical protein E9993_13170 [Labilibacter sediminis]|nr:hypothetical protein E9993_13170 [Labilibacter sediminis]
MKFLKTTTQKCIALICATFLFLSIYAQAQSCNDVFDFCPPTNKLFNKQAFARSYKIKPNQKLQLIQVFYGGTAYHINLCKEEFLGDFRVRILDFNTKKVLWDNIDDHFSTSISISFGSSQRIFLEITPQNPENFRGISRCLGIVVRYYRNEKLKDDPPTEPPGSF